MLVVLFLKTNPSQKIFFRKNKRCGAPNIFLFVQDASTSRLRGYDTVYTNSFLFPTNEASGTSFFTLDNSNNLKLLGLLCKVYKVLLHSWGHWLLYILSL